MRKISVIIVTYNSVRHIYDCLESVFKFNDIGDELEVIVVDNNSNQWEEMFVGLRQKYNNAITLLNSNKNGGYGYGNNVGVKYSNSDLFIVMNPDVRLVEPIFKSVIKELEKEDTGLIGVKFVDGSLPFYVKPEKVNLWNQLIHPLRILFKMYNEKTMYMSGSFLAFKKRAFYEAGMFDEHIFMYTEEPDITNRIQAKGYHAEWCPTIHVRHLAHGRGFSIKTEEMTTQSLFYYAGKYNMNLNNNIRVKIKMLGIKRLVARIMNNKFKVELFGQRLNYLKQLQETL